MIEILKRFCDPNDDREYRKTPLTVGDFTYATNGYCIIEVPAVEGCKVADISVLPKKLQEPWKFMAEQYEGATEGHEFPTDLPKIKSKPCRLCDGTGRNSLCKECEGEGVVDFSNAYGNYEMECQSCGGDGYVSGKEVCAYCAGEGKLEEQTDVKLNHMIVDACFLRNFVGLSNLKLWLPKERDKAVVVTFDGGRGAIMPIVR